MDQRGGRHRPHLGHDSDLRQLIATFSATRSYGGTSLDTVSPKLTLTEPSVRTLLTSAQPASSSLPAAVGS